MKTVSKLLLLTLTVSLVGCNEKVSPELQSSNATTPTSNNTAAPSEYYFSVTNSSADVLGYKLHKTGSGNASSKCEVRSSTELSNDNFRGNPAANDITCYFDAEELALFNGGFKFKLNASKNTCEYVSYRPFGFFTRMPGDSTASYYQFTCGNTSTTSANIADVAVNTLGLNIANTIGNPGCGDFLVRDNLIPVGQRETFTVATDEELCRFKYTDENELNCDIGKITIDEINVTFTAGVAPDPDTLTYTRSSRTVKCGGKIHNCMEGAIREHTTAATDMIYHNQTTVGVNFEKEYEYPGLEGDGVLWRYSNFRRNLASINLDFEDSFGLPPAYKSSFGDPTYSKIFNPQVLDYYSYNLMMDNATPLISSADIITQARSSNKWYAVPYAGEPYMGLNGAHVNPFYTMYCLDSAFDMKARVRMFVRDWDRVFPTSSSDIEYVSDIFKGANARQDNNLVEISDDMDGVNNFDDLIAWDEQIPMTRTPGVFDPFTTIWQPKAGWFTGFPNYVKE